LRNGGLTRDPWITLARTEGKVDIKQRCDVTGDIIYGA
jgi:hypothetical protein